MQKLITFLLVLLVLIPGASIARIVTLNYAFTIGSDKNNTIRVNGTNYSTNQTSMQSFVPSGASPITSERNNSIFALTFAGRTLFSSMFNTSYSSPHYMLSMTQAGSGNKVLVSFTNGTWADVQDSVSHSSGFIPSRTVGNVVRNDRKASDLFIIAEYADADITNSLRFDGSSRLYVKNNGISNGLPNISITLLSGG